MRNYIKCLFGFHIKPIVCQCNECDGWNKYTYCVYCYKKLKKKNWIEPK